MTYKTLHICSKVFTFFFELCICSPMLEFFFFHSSEGCNRGKEPKVLLYGALSAGSWVLWLELKLMPGSLVDPSNSKILMILTKWCTWEIYAYLSFKKNFRPVFDISPMVGTWCQDLKFPHPKSLLYLV